MDSVCLAECPREHTLRRVALRRNGTVLLSSLTYGPLSYDGRFEIVRSQIQPQPAPTANVIPSGDDLSSRFSWDTSIATHRVAQPNSAVISIAESVDDRSGWVRKIRVCSRCAATKFLP